MPQHGSAAVHYGKNTRFRLHSFAHGGSPLYAYTVDQTAQKGADGNPRLKFTFLYAFCLQASKLPDGQPSISAGTTALVMPRIINYGEPAPNRMHAVKSAAEWRNGKAKEKAIPHAPHAQVFCPYQKCSFGQCQCGRFKYMGTRAKIAALVSTPDNWYSSTTFHKFPDLSTGWLGEKYTIACSDCETSAERCVSACGRAGISQSIDRGWLCYY